MCLMVSIVFRKRAIPLCWVTRTGKKGHFPQSMHIDLLREVSKLLPPTRVVILGDGEFDGKDWLDFIQAQGWEFVLRTSLDRKIEDFGEATTINKLGSGFLEDYVWAEKVLDGKYSAILWHEKNILHLFLCLQIWIWQKWLVRIIGEDLQSKPCLRTSNLKGFGCIKLS